MKVSFSHPFSIALSQQKYRMQNSWYMKPWSGRYTSKQTSIDMIESNLDLESKRDSGNGSYVVTCNKPFSVE